jgi:hypothetical protein
MEMKRLYSIWAVGLLVIATLLYAETVSALTILDFEAPLPVGLTAIDYHQGIVVPDSAKVTDQYIDMGVRISDAALVELGPGHAPSGINGLAGIDQFGEINYDAPVTFSFFSPLDGTTPATTDYFGYSPDLWGYSYNEITLTAYGLDDSIVGQISYTETGIFDPASPLTISGIGYFHKITIDSTLQYTYRGGIGIDMVRFEDLQVNSIPEPSTLLLLGLGIVGLIGSRIKRKKT